MKHGIVACALVGVCLLPAASARQVVVVEVADWDLCQPPLMHRDWDWDSDHCVAVLAYGHAWASALAARDQFSASGEADENSSFCDVRAAASAAGGLAEQWVFKEPGTGDIEYGLEARVDALALLQNADCAAAASGWVQLSSPQIGTLLAEASAAGQTVAGHLGSLELQLGGKGGQGGLNLPLTIGLGTGRYVDNKYTPLVGSVCENTFQRTQTTKCKVEVWADGGWLSLDNAECSARIDGRLQGDIFLSRCPQ